MKANNKQPIGKKIRIGVLIAVGIILVTALPVVLHFFPYDYARSEVSATEESLVSKGFVKVCSVNTPGRGIDSQHAEYRAVYQFKGSQEDAASILRKVTTDSGFNIGSGRLDDYGDLNFTDNTSKKSPYSQLNDGNVDLRITVYKNKKPSGDAFCTLIDNQNSSEVAVILAVLLPDFR